MNINLSSERRVRGLTQKELAIKSGLSLNTIHRAESGATEPRIKTINVIMDALALEPVSPPASFSEALIQARAKKGLTQEQLAARAGISRSTIAKAEAGDTSPQPPAIRAMLDAGLDIDLSLIVPEDLSAAASLGQFLRIARQRQLLTMTEVQNSTGIVTRTLERIEDDRTTPRAQTLGILADTYELAIDSPM